MSLLFGEDTLNLAVLTLVGYPVNTLPESKAVQLKTASSLEIYVWHTCIIFSSQTVKFGSQATSYL